MKFTLSWLRDYLDTEASLEEICDSLTDIGLEVESVEDKAELYRDFSVAQIISATAHENSNKLKICQVQSPISEKPLQIICGAKNARQGLKVAFAKIGSVIPSNDMVIKKAKIAGVESSGMLCSAQELKLGEDGEGIIEIDDKWPVGSAIAEVFGLDDAVIEINVTPNRGDCLGVYGIARDLAAAGLGSLKMVEFNKVKKEGALPITIENKDQPYCGAISFCHIKDVKNCQSPSWLQNRLNAVGVNPISAIVDITNYVMLCLNQPMHAYDAKKIDKSLKVILAKDGEKFTTLKDQEIITDNKSLMIADNSKNLALAGIVGGKNSTCDLDSNEIILEAAFFDPSNIARSGRKFNILSDSRYRFERGVDQKNAILAMEYAAALIVKICGGKVSEIESSINQQYKIKEVSFKINDFENLIGIAIAQDKALEILQNLGLTILKDDKKEGLFTLEIPSWRHDISCQQDIIEELIRIYGYDKIKNQEFAAQLKINSELDSTKQIKINLAAKGYVETISWSFIDANIVNDFTDYNQDMELANPISQDLNYLRPNLIVGLLHSLQSNAARGFEDLSFFEIGNVFIDKPSQQQSMVCGLRVGKVKPDNHYKENRDFDAFDIKKDFFDIAEIFSLKSQNLQIESSNPTKYYHPYRCAQVKLGKKVIGYFGEIHPAILQKFDIKSRAYAFEVFVDQLPKLTNKLAKQYIALDFQAVERDFAFLLDEESLIGGVIDDILKIDRKLIQDVAIFDIYRGSNIEDGKKSVALRVKMQSAQKTLTSAEIDDISAQITNIITDKYKAKLRSN